MRLLLDENLPHDLRHLIPGHEVVTVTYIGWSGIQNGEFLARASAEGFDALITKDAAMESQHNPGSLAIAVVILEAPTNDIDDIRPLVPALLGVLSTPLPRAFVRVGRPT